MKVSVIRPSSYEEDEIIFRCHTLSDDMDRLIHRLRYGEIKFTGYDEHGISTIVASDIYYFETVDNKVFAYCRQSVYEVKGKTISARRGDRRTSIHEDFKVHDCKY